MNLVISIFQISNTNWIDIISTYLDSWLYYKLWKSLFWWVFVWFDSFLDLGKKDVECQVLYLFLSLLYQKWFGLNSLDVLDTNVLLPSLVHNKIMPCFSSNLFLNISLYVWGLISPLSQRPYFVSFVISSRYKA